MIEHPHHKQTFVDEQVFGRFVIGFWKPSGLTARIALIIAALVNLAIVSAVAGAVGIPQLQKFDGSLMHQPSLFLATLTIAILLVATTLIGTILAGAVRFEAGVFAAAVGLIAITLRTGTMQTVLFETNGAPSTYIGLAFELILLGAILLGSFALLRIIAKSVPGMLHKPRRHDAPEVADEDAPMPTPPPEEWMQKITAMAVQVLISAVILMFLCQSAAKYQTLASLALASMIGTIFAYISFPARPSAWFWLGPIVLGIIGYALAAAGQDGSLAVGLPSGIFAGLARPLPMDYASVGTASAMLGYWVMHKPA
jgi:hypothetical protein